MITLADVADDNRLRRILNPRRTRSWGNALLRNPPAFGPDTYEFFTDVTAGLRFHEVRQAIVGAAPWGDLVQDDVPKRLSWSEVARAARAGRTVSKKNTRAVHQDSRVDHARQLALLGVLRPLVDATLTRVAVAYVDDVVMHDVIERAIVTIRERGLVYGKTLDLRDCFGQVDWHLLDQAIDRHLAADVSPDVLGLLKSVYRVRVVRRKDGSEVQRSKGIPQGGVLAPLLLNLFLSDFDRRVQKRIGRLGVLLWRYCDDILVVAPTLAALKAATAILFEEVQRVRMTIKPETNHVTDLRNPQNPHLWLGYAFTTDRVWVPRGRVEAKAAEMLDGIYAGRLGVEDVEERLLGLVASHNVIHIEEAERAASAIRTLIQPFLAAAPKRQEGIVNVRRQIEKKPPARWSQSAPAGGMKNVVSTLGALPSALDVAFGHSPGPRGQWRPEGSALHGGEDGRKAVLEAWEGTPRGGAQTHRRVAALSEDGEAITGAGQLVGRPFEVISEGAVNIIPLSTPTARAAEASVSGDRTAHPLQQIVEAVTARITVTASAINTGETTLTWSDGTRTKFEFTAAGAYSREEVTLYGYLLGIRAAARGEAERAVLVVHERTIHGAIWRSFRIRSVFVMRRWTALLDATDTSSIDEVAFVDRDGVRASVRGGIERMLFPSARRTPREHGGLQGRSLR